MLYIAAYLGLVVVAALLFRPDFFFMNMEKGGSIKSGWVAAIQQQVCFMWIKINGVKLKEKTKWPHLE